MSNPAPQLVQKLRNYCNILPLSPRLRRTGRDDGLLYGDYVDQLIPPSRDCCLKMADEQSRLPFTGLKQRRDAAATVPREFAWPSLLARIAAKMERRLSVVEELESVVSANLQRAVRLRQSILQRAFSGQL